MRLFWKCSSWNVIAWARLWHVWARCSHKHVWDSLTWGCSHSPCLLPLSSSHVCTALSRVPIVTPWTVALQAPPSVDFSGKDTGVGCHFLLQGIFLTQGWNLRLLCLLHCRWILYPLSHQAGPCLPDMHAGWVSLAPASVWLFSLFELDHLSFFLGGDIALLLVSAQHSQASHLRKGGLSCLSKYSKWAISGNWVAVDGPSHHLLTLLPCGLF